MPIDTYMSQSQHAQSSTAETMRSSYDADRAFESSAHKPLTEQDFSRAAMSPEERLQADTTWDLSRDETINSGVFDQMNKEGKRDNYFTEQRAEVAPAQPNKMLTFTHEMAEGLARQPELNFSRLVNLGNHLEYRRQMAARN